VVDAAGTLGEYVVTPELVKCFDQALDFIRAAVTGRTSKATYLHGSFGSGKSHYLAVLHLILQGNPQARGIPELAGVIARHNDWLQGKRFLLVPYHMIGAHSMESGVFGGYVDFIRRTHTQAPVPGVFLAERLFDDARHLRQTIGDGPFFDRLNADPASGAASARRCWSGATGGRTPRRSPPQTGSPPCWPARSSRSRSGWAEGRCRPTTCSASSWPPWTGPAAR
jgi:hypothetical protein